MTSPYVGGRSRAARDRPPPAPVPEDAVDEVLAVLGEGEAIPVADARFEDAARHSRHRGLPDRAWPTGADGRELYEVGVATTAMLEVLRRTRATSVTLWTTGT